MKILVVCNALWRNDKNAGNVLSNIFKGIDAEFAQIYTASGTPNNDICRRYFQITDSMIIRNWLWREPVGRMFNYDKFDAMSFSQNIEREKSELSKFQFFRRHRLTIFFILREIAWRYSGWKKGGVLDFAEEFKPDLIFSLCGDSPFMLELNIFLSNHLHVPTVSYIFDDVYSLRAFSLSPFFWVRRFSLRKWIKKAFRCYEYVYTMTEEQQAYIEDKLHANIGILRKSGESRYQERGAHNPIRIVFAGNLLYHRYKTIISIRNAIGKINKDGQKMHLDIYTGTELPGRKIMEILDDGINSSMHSLVAPEKVMDIYAGSDIALHVESFDLKDRLMVRMSFSTKIVDCLESGCAIVAIADQKQAGLQYLKKEDAAICVTKQDDIERTLKRLIDHPVIIEEYKLKAKKCLEKNHDSEKNRKMLENDFERIMKKDALKYVSE